VKDTWKLSDPLIKWSKKNDYHRIRDSLEGIQITGSPGAGKTSGPLKYLLKSYLYNNFGGLVLCAKDEEITSWVDYATEAGRLDDIVYLSKESLDFLKYESENFKEGEGEVENIVDIFMQVAEVGNSDRGSSNEKYWDRAGRQLLRNVITLLKLASEDITLDNIAKIIADAPKSIEECGNIEWQSRSYCHEVFQIIINRQNINTQTLKHEYELTVRYFLNEFPNMDSRTRGNIVSFFTTMADSFLRGKVREVFCSGHYTITPDDCLKGKIIIVDFSRDTWREIGRYIAIIMKYLTQISIQRRVDKGTDQCRPVFIFGDESHFFVTKHDQLFQTVSRSSRGFLVYGTQNYPNYMSTLKDKNVVDSLLGNLGTKIFCQNGDPETNKWASESINKEVIKRKGTSNNVTHTFLGNTNRSESTTEQKDYIVDPIEFQKLSRGGKEYNYKVGAIIWQSGRVWKNKKTFLNTIFFQKKQKENTYFGKMGIPFKLSPYLFLGLLVYFMFIREKVHIIDVTLYYSSNIHWSYIVMGLAAVFVIPMWVVLSNIDYLYPILFAGLICILSANAFYLYGFSLHESIVIFIINVSLILFYLFKLPKVFNLSNIDFPSIMR